MPARRAAPGPDSDVSEIELEIGAANGPDEFVIRVINALSGGEPSTTTHLDVDGLIRERDALEEIVLASASDGGLAGSEEKLRDIGGRLFDALFVGPVLGTYRASMGIAGDRKERLRIVLRLTAPKLAALPWEALYDNEIGAYICRKEPLVRRVHAPYTAEPRELVPPLRVLGLVAAPRGLPELDVPAEQRRLSEALSDSIRDGDIELEWLPEASWDAVHQKLLAGHWHVLHFIGHGDYDVDTDEGVIDLVGPDGAPNPVGARALADLLDQADESPRLVVLNSCSSGAGGTRDLFSGTAAALVHSGVSAVAAMQFTVSDGAALAFARGFYRALATGHGIDGAIRSGRISMLGTPNTLEWVTPVLHVRGATTDLFTPTAGDDTSDAMPQDRPTKGDARWRNRTVLALAVGVVVVIAAAAAALWWPRSAPAGLEVVDLAVSSGDSRAVDADNDAWELVPPTVQITVRNIGDHVSVITGARLEVVDYTHLPICWGAGGALTTSQTYDVALPVDPTLHDVVPVAVAQEIPPDRADRFELALQMPDPDPARGTYLYRLKLSLARDGSADDIEAGYVIVAAPLLNGLPFNRADLTYPGAVGECIRRSVAEYQRAQGWEGVRSPDLSTDVFSD